MSHRSRKQEIVDEDTLDALSAAAQPNDEHIYTNELESHLLGGVAPDNEYEYHWLDVAKSRHNGPYNDQLVEEVKGVYSVFFIPSIYDDVLVGV